MEVFATDALPSVEGIHTNEAEPRPEDAFSGDASAPRSPRSQLWDLVVGSPSLSLPRDPAPSDMISAPGSSDIVDPLIHE
jgi:hypothetical protein